METNTSEDQANTNADTNHGEPLKTKRPNRMRPILDTAKDKKKRKKPPKDKQPVDYRWIVFVLFFSFSAAALMYMLNEKILSDMSVTVAFVLLFSIVLLGIAFDIIGLAVTTAAEGPFHAMAARKQPSGKIAVQLIRSATRVSSFCNDVVGDISGVVSGATAAAIAVTVFSSDFAFWGKMLVTALVSAMTVGGKAFGKSFAIRYNKQIVHGIARFFCFFTYFRFRKNPAQARAKGADNQEKKRAGKPKK